MKHAAACALLMLTGCSQEMMRYDAEPSASATAYRPATVAQQDFAIGFQAIKNGDYTAAEPPLTRYLRAEPNDPYALLAMGSVMERMDRETDAITYYRTAALYGETAALGEILNIDTTIAQRPKTIRDLALLNIVRLE